MSKPRKKSSESVLAAKMAKALAAEIRKAALPAEMQDISDRIAALELPQARYEAAMVPYQTRSWLYEGVQDAKYDIDPYTRTELLRVSRYFEKNSWVSQRLSAVFNQYTFGPHGLQFTPATEDEDFNQVAGPWWNSWSKFPDQTSQQPLGVLERVMGTRWFFDGEISLYKTKSPDTGRPRVQLIEAHRIQNPGTDIADNGNYICDGVELDDSSGRPTAFYVAQIQAGSYLGGYAGSYMNSGLLGNLVPSPLVSQAVEFVRVPAERMIRLFEPSRAGQHRGIGSLHSVLRTIQDLHELNFLEKLRAKDAARTSAWITTPTGQANARGLRALNLSTGSANQAGQLQIKPAPQYFETVEGAERQYLKLGEDVKFLANPNPSASAQWFYDYLVRQICAGSGISALLVMPWSLQGTVTRADLDIMSGYFRCKSSVAIAAIRELYVYVMGWAVKYDRQLDGAPDDWFEVTATPPRSPNVDVGRNSAAIISEYQAGLRTLADICGELGHDWRRVLKQRSIEYKFSAALAKELGIDPEKLLQMSAAAATKPPTQEDDPLPSRGASAIEPALTI